MNKGTQVKRFVTQNLKNAGVSILWASKLEQIRGIELPVVGSVPAYLCVSPETGLRLHVAT